MAGAGEKSPETVGPPGSVESAPSLSPPSGLWVRWVRVSAGAPESWGRRKKVVPWEAGRTHLAPCGMKS